VKEVLFVDVDVGSKLRLDGEAERGVVGLGSQGREGGTTVANFLNLWVSSRPDENHVGQCFSDQTRNAWAD